MKLCRDNDAEIWYHGSNKTFSLLREGSTVTLDRPLAEAFSHKHPVRLRGSRRDFAQWP